MLVLAALGDTLDEINEVFVRLELALGHFRVNRLLHISRHSLVHNLPFAELTNKVFSIDGLVTFELSLPSNVEVLKLRHVRRLQGW